jgi:ankyrin repeat protein
VKALLEKGAKTEVRNWLGFTPLMWASLIGNEGACKLLIDHKADVKADSVYGTAVESAAMSGNPKVLKLLLDNGAPLSKERVDKIGALATAADQGQPEMVRMLLALKTDVNAVDDAGMTPLMHAARRGQMACAQLLLDNGAKVEPADMWNRTALHYAAQNGHADMAGLLISKGAKVDAADKQGNTPLLLAARYGGDVATVNALTKAGANPDAKDAKGRSAADIAAARGYTACARALRAGAKAAPITASVQERSKKAVLASLTLIETSTKAFSGRGGCMSCHHQGLGLFTTGVAKASGYKIDPDLANSEMKLVTIEGDTRLDQLRGLVQHPEAYKFLPAVDMEEFAPGLGSGLVGLASHNLPPRESIGILTTILARQQRPDGSWAFVFHREPVQSSPFMSTAYTIRGLKTYMPQDLAKERDERIANALKWVVNTPARTNEDRTFKLLAMKWAGGSAEDISKASADLLRTQKPDGGWAQFSGPSPFGPGYDRSDAYATGQALYALRAGAGMAVTNPVYARGVDYLLRTQDEDGSWFVNKRAVPANNWFDTGFPHGESQYISYCGTCWATLALMPVSQNERSASAK